MGTWILFAGGFFFLIVGWKAKQIREKKNDKR